MAWLAGCGLTPAHAQGVCTSVQPIEQAQRTVWHGDQLIDSARVSLPDRIPRAWRSGAFQLRYQLDTEACGATGRALLLRRVGGPYQILSNGRPLAPVRPDSSTPDKPYNGRVGGVFALGPQDHRIEVALTSLPNVGGGLIGVSAGPQAEVLNGPAVWHFRWQQFHLFAGVVIGMAGMLALLVWSIRRQDRQSLWFGACCLLWTLRGQLLQSFNLPIGALAFEQLNPLLVWAAALCITASTLCSIDSMTTARARWLRLQAGALPVGYLLSVWIEALTLPYRSLAFALSFAQLFWMVWLLAHKLNRLRTSHAVWLSLGYCAVMVGATHDIAMIVGLLEPGWWSLLTPGFTVLLLCHLVASGLYLLQNLQRAEGSNQELERHLHAQTTRLEASYALLRESEREAARTQEREHLLREMHDGLGAQLMTAMRGVERGTLAREQVLLMLQDSLDDLRLLMDSTDLGRQLQGALATWRHRWHPRLEALGLALHWHVDDGLDAAQLQPDAVLQLMRILQEATVNVVKHAQASSFRVMAVWEPGTERTLVFEVTDNGQGLPATPTTRSGRGLRNMETRAALLGAELTLGAAAGGGTALRLRLPLPTA